MSKIQKALRRIQGEKVPPVSALDPKSSEASPQRVATLTHTQALKRLDDASGDTRLLEVDRGKLRESGLLAPENQERHIADQYRLIKRPILELASGTLADTPAHGNLVMVASALPGDGKTFNAINIALSIAVEKDKSVLLVDADVAKPHISTIFDLRDEPGLIDVLVDPSISVSDVILKSDVPNLSFLPSGRHDEHATELLASRRMVKVLSQLAEEMPDRIVIFDSPPLLVTSESRVLASKMGQIALVVCAGITPRHAVLAAIDSLDEEQPVNLILNQASGAFGDGAYGNYGYGYGTKMSLTD